MNKRIIQHSRHGIASWSPKSLSALGKDEAYLESVIAETPEILGLESFRSGIQGPFAAFRQLNLTTPQGRSIVPDIVLLAASGHLIIVEVKLGTNPDLRSRAVLAQVVDYAATFTALSASSLLGVFTGKDHDGEATWPEWVQGVFPDFDRAEELAQTFVRRAQQGEVNLVIACDGAPPGLREVVHGVARQTGYGFDLDLVEITPYANEAEDSLLFVPQSRLQTEIVGRTAIHITLPEDGIRPNVNVQSTDAETIEEQVRTLSEGARPGRKWTDAETIKAFEEEGDALALRLLEIAMELNPRGALVAPGTRKNPSFGLYVAEPTGTEPPRQAASVAVGSPAIYFSPPFVERVGGPDLVEWYQNRLLELFPDEIPVDKNYPSVPKEAVEREWEGVETLLRELSRLSAQG